MNLFSPLVLYMVVLYYTIMIERKYLDGIIVPNESSKELILCDYDKIMDITRKYGKVLSVKVSISKIWFLE